jgi:hypothetical protein
MEINTVDDIISFFNVYVEQCYTPTVFVSKTSAISNSVLFYSITETVNNMVISLLCDNSQNEHNSDDLQHLLSRGLLFTAVSLQHAVQCIVNSTGDDLQTE